MAAHSLSIAKASLLASCLRPDHTKLNRDDLTRFHSYLEDSIFRCTPSHIQKTKTWLLQNILLSSIRTAAFSRYLVSLSKNVTVLSYDNSNVRTCRRRLHLLYMLNDLLHHVKHHNPNVNIRQNVEDYIHPVLPDLFANAAVEKKSRTVKRLHSLVDIWRTANYCELSLLDNLSETLLSGAAVKTATETRTTETDANATPKELPWMMPSTHGDPTAPFFDLPAANLMPYIVPNSSRPIRPDQVRALHLTKGPADESLVNALRDFLKDVKSIDDPYTPLEDEGIVPEIDEIGQITYKNEADDVVGDTYYGWSKAFCEKMKNRDKDEEHDNQRGRSLSSDDSRNLSQSPRKRRRYSSSRSRSRSRSRSSYRNSPPPRFGSNSKQSSPPPTRDLRAYPQNPPSFRNNNLQHSSSLPPPPPPPPMDYSHFSVPPPPSGQQFLPSGLPVPPRPPNWQGPWPPPPPPPSDFTVPHMSFPPPPPNFNQPGYRRR